MDNENKELEFDPTESEDFYSNLEAAIGEEQEAGDTDLPELFLPEETFALDNEEEQPAENAVEEELFAGVDAALSEQIEQEFGADEEEYGDYDEEPGLITRGWRAIPGWTKVLVGVILALLISVGLLFGTKGGRKLIYNIVIDIMFEDVPVDPGDTTPVPDYTATETPEPTEVPEPTADPGQNPTTAPEPTADPGQNPTTAPEPTVDPNQNPDATPAPTETPTPTPRPVVEIKDDDNIINVLLLGEENIYGGIRGRTDAILVVSINLEGGPLKVISFQRDLYVYIPGKSEDRLNAAYARGNFPSIVAAIEENFGIDIDAYAKVDFKGFENLIDQLGGLNISLTAKESDYLNTTRYISKPSQRNTVAGYQQMTGAQVLGYCRVRYVPTAEGITGDRGRNLRHRIVLQALFDKFKDQNVTQIVAMIPECKSYVTVSSNLEDLAKKCVFAVMENKMFEIETHQVPQSGMYENQTVTGPDGNPMSVVKYFPGCVTKLQKFIYGE